MKKSVAVLLVLLSLTSFAQSKLSLQPAPPNAELFAPGIISTGFNERDFALSPDGAELYYTLQSPQGIFQTILYMKKDGKGNWSSPQVAPFAGMYSDLEPAFSPDGKKLFFSSNRPVSGDKPKDFDIWVVERQGGGWSAPKNLGAPVNTGEDEFYPSIARNGNLYYTAQYKNGVGKEDIFLAHYDKGQYADPVALDTGVNSKAYEFNAYVSPDESVILFTSYGRKDDKGRGDLYMSVKDASGRWLPAVNLAAINSNKLDYCPFISPDGSTLFFTSERINIPASFTGTAATASNLKTLFTSPQNGGGDIYWMNFEALRKQLPPAYQKQ